MSRHDLCEGAGISLCRNCIRNQDNLPPGTDTSGRGWVPATETDACSRWLSEPRVNGATRSPPDRL